jgi:hypothetical protein
MVEPGRSPRADAESRAETTDPSPPGPWQRRSQCHAFRIASRAVER